jgi:hypothetical protein
MRRVSLVCLTVFLAAGLATFASLFAVYEARSQVRGAQSQNAAEGAAASDTAPPEPASDETFVSQGAFIGRTASEATLNAVAKDLAEEERLADYSQVVDNDTSAQSDMDQVRGWLARELYNDPIPPVRLRKSRGSWQEDSAPHLGQRELAHKP